MMKPLAPGFPGPASSNRFPSEVLLPSVILILAAFLRLQHLDAQSVWADESVSIWMARMPWREFLGALRHDEPNMTLYYALLRPWLHLGQSEFAIRMLSVLFSVATVAAVYALGARLFGSRVGLVASLLVTLNAFHVEYAQEARSYSLTAFLVSVSALSYTTAIERPSWGAWAAYVATGVLAVYSHVFAALALIAQWVALAFLRPRGVPWRAALVSALLIGLLVLPLVVFVIVGDRGQLGWLDRPTLGAVPRVLVTLSGASASRPAHERGLFVSPEAERKLLILLYFALCTTALAVAVNSWIRERASIESWHYGLIVSWLVVPILLAFGASFTKPIFFPRYLIFSLVPLALMAAIGISQINRRWLFVTVLAAAVALAGQQLSVYYRYAAKDDWRGTTRYIVSQAEPGDAIIFYPIGPRAFEYYRDRHARNDARVAHIPLAEYALGRRDAIAFAKGQFNPRPLQDVSERFRRIWLVLKDDFTMPQTPVGPMDLRALGGVIQTSLARAHVLALHEKFGGGIRVLFYVAQ